MIRVPTRIPTLDALVALAVVIAAVAMQPDYPGPQPLATVVAAAWSATLLLRTVAPLAMAVGAAALAMVYVALPEVNDTTLAAFVVLLVATFTVGANLEGRRRWWAVAALLTSTYVAQIVTSWRPGGDTQFGDVYLSPPLLMLPVLGGALLRHARQQTAEVRRLSELLRIERDAHARDAAAAERIRIAREIHDVVSHSVGVIVVQAGAASVRLPEGSPERAQVETIRDVGRDALGELRRQLGVLRGSEVGDPATLPAPMPTLDQLPRLTEASGARLEVTGDLRDLPSGVGTTAFRVVQEALTNARRHATDAEIDVHVVRRDDALTVDVVNAAGAPVEPQSAPGYGLVGMRERVATCGGEVSAGPTATGGWRVRARLPLERRPVGTPAP